MGSVLALHITMRGKRLVLEHTDILIGLHEGLTLGHSVAACEDGVLEFDSWLLDHVVQGARSGDAMPDWRTGDI